MVSGSFDPAETITWDELAAAWRTGSIHASADTAAALGALLGPLPASALLPAGARPAPTTSERAIVAAHELTPAWSVLAVDGHHPLEGDGGPLAIDLCGPAGPSVANVDPAHVTRLVMSGTTALTGRTAERIDTSGVTDTIRYIQPFFASAELVHLSNEVSFVRDCKPRTGLKELVFCARDRYVALLEALHARLVELTGSHLVDYGPGALQRTIDVYARHGWIWFGGGRTQLDATEPRLVEDHGNRLAFVGCNAVNWWVRAISPGPGVATCDWPRMVWQIQELRRRGYTPIATVQHRELRDHAPPADLVADLRRLAEAGAAFVLSSQAHVAHPWDVHYGAYVHYGPGNILFAQYREAQREASVDKLYLHEGSLLTVAHLYTRTEHGQPRQLTPAERERFLGALEVAAAKIAPPEPWARPRVPAAGRDRPDSLVIRGRSQKLLVTTPAHLDPHARYPLVVALADPPVPAADAFVVVRAGKPIATGPEIASFMGAKYPIDPAKVSFVPGHVPDRVPAPARRHRHHRR